MIDYVESSHPCVGLNVGRHDMNTDKGGEMPVLNHRAISADLVEAASRIMVCGLIFSAIMNHNWPLREWLTIWWIV